MQSKIILRKKYNHIYVEPKQQLAGFNFRFSSVYFNAVPGFSLGIVLSLSQPKSFCDVTDHSAHFVLVFEHPTFHVWLYYVHKKYPRAWWGPSIGISPQVRLLSGWRVLYYMCVSWLGWGVGCVLPLCQCKITSTHVLGTFPQDMSRACVSTYALGIYQSN